METKDKEQHPVDDPQDDSYNEVGRRLLAAILSCQLGIGLEYTLRRYVPQRVDPSWGRLGLALQRCMMDCDPFIQAPSDQFRWEETKGKIH